MCVGASVSSAARVQVFVEPLVAAASAAAAAGDGKGKGSPLSRYEVNIIFQVRACAVAVIGRI